VCYFFPLESITGLTILVVDVLEQDPQSGHLFIFRNRANNKLKMVYWDRNGFMLLYKRLEKGKFKFSKQSNVDRLLIEVNQLEWLLAGQDFMSANQFPKLKFERY